MRTITLIVIHCSATPEGKSLSAEACRQDHILHRGFRDIGYHFYITRDGEIHRGRALERLEHTAVIITPIRLVFVMREDWMRTENRKIRVHWNKKELCLLC